MYTSGQFPINTGGVRGPGDGVPTPARRPPPPVPANTGGQTPATTIVNNSASVANAPSGNVARQTAKQGQAGNRITQFRQQTALKIANFAVTRAEKKLEKATLKLNQTDTETADAETRLMSANTRRITSSGARAQQTSGTNSVFNSFRANFDRTSLGKKSLGNRMSNAGTIKKEREVEVKVAQSALAKAKAAAQEVELNHLILNESDPTRQTALTYIQNANKAIKEYENSPKQLASRLALTDAKRELADSRIKPDDIEGRELLNRTLAKLNAIV